MITNTEEDAAPLGADEFAYLLDPLASPETKIMALAVSGGPDSMALALCAQRWAPPRNIKLIALIVDHQLRAESGTEAQQVRDKLVALGVSTEILRWEHSAITTRIHQTARRARYDLLTAACHHHGAKHLLTAHQREDQAETILMRFAKGSGIDGLAGMEISSKLNNITLLRPLLAIPKARLIATCETAKMPFVTDPSNMAEHYARGRLRRIMPLLESEGLTLDRLIDLGERANEARAALDHYTQELLARAAQRDKFGVWRIDAAALAQAPPAIAARALTRCMQEINREDYAPERKPLLNLLATLTAEDEIAPRSLHGCSVKKTNGTITLLRELSALTDAQPITAGQTMMWDRRWEIFLPASYAGPALTIRPLGTQDHATLDSLAPRLRHTIAGGRIRATLPALWAGNQLALIPALPADTAETPEPLTRARLLPFA